MLLKNVIKKYFISLVVFIFVIIVINLTIGSDLLLYFIKNFFVNGELVNDGSHYITGGFKVVKFIKFLIFFLFCIYTLIFIDLIYSLHYEKKKFKAKNLKEIQNRVKQVIARENIKTDDEYFELDNALKKILSSQDKFKNKYDENMSKLNLSMAFLAHDLRTPLTSIIGYSDLLANEAHLENTSRQKYIDIVRAKSIELEGLIDQFFTFTKAQLKAENLVKSNFDIYEFFIQIKETFYPHINEKKIDILILVPEKQYIIADPNALARCFNNIIKNAVLYSPNNSIIEISFEIVNSEYIIRVKNRLKKPNSIDIMNIFQPFYRGDYSRNDTIKGSGLGLNVAKSIIENHGGEINASLNDGSIEILVRIPF